MYDLFCGTRKTLVTYACVVWAEISFLKHTEFGHYFFNYYLVLIFFESYFVCIYFLNIFLSIGDKEVLFPHIVCSMYIYIYTHGWLQSVIWVPFYKTMYATLTLTHKLEARINSTFINSIKYNFPLQVLSSYGFEWCLYFRCHGMLFKDWVSKWLRNWTVLRKWISGNYVPPHNTRKLNCQSFKMFLKRSCIHALQTNKD